jgi:hypothetical protein
MENSRLCGQGRNVVTLRKALSDHLGEHLHVTVASPGGDVGAAYLVARELRRRFARLTTGFCLTREGAFYSFPIESQGLPGARGMLGG